MDEPLRRLSLHNTTVNDIPDEILYDIFFTLVQLEFYEHFDLDSSAPSRAWYSYPWILSEMCIKWRRVCLNNTRLWCYIGFGSGHNMYNCGEPEGQYEVCPILRTHLQLERSRNMPLFIEIDSLCPCTSQVARFRAIAAHASRWKEVSISLGGYGDLSYIETLFAPGQVLSSLQEVVYSGVHGHDDYTNLILPLNPDALPKLHSATFSYLEGDDERLALFPWGQLTHLYLYEHNGTAEDLLTILSKCPNLNDLGFFFTQDAWRDDDSAIASNGPDVSLPHLHHLDMDNTHRPSIDCLLPHIQVPNLRSLTYGHLRPDSIAKFTAFVTPFSKSLTGLNIHYPATSLEEFMQIFNTLRHIQSLTFSWHRPSPNASQLCDEFLKRTTRSTSAGSDILPHLRHLSLHDLEFDPTALELMVESRLATPTGSDDIECTVPNATVLPLESVSIEFSSYKDELPSIHYHRRVAREFLWRYVDEGRLKLKIS